MSPIIPGSGPIAIFDSGIGGLPYLSAAREALPTESFIYVADRRGFPYGTKTRTEVRDIVLRLVASLVRSYSPKAIVIACNTASQAGLEAARKANPGLPIIGTVPAVKPAAERSRSGVIGVLATAGAVEDPYLDSLEARYAKGLSVIREGAQELVSFVERRSSFAGAEERRAAVAPYVRRLAEGGADVIVLACTHFLHLRDDIAAEAGPAVEVVDSRAGVVKRLRQVLGERGLLNSVDPVARERGLLNSVDPVARERGLLNSVDPVARERGLFLVTGEEPFEPEYRLIAEAFGLPSPGLLPAIEPAASVAWKG